MKGVLVKWHDKHGSVVREDVVFQPTIDEEIKRRIMQHYSELRRIDVPQQLAIETVARMNHVWQEQVENIISIKNGISISSVVESLTQKEPH